MKLKESTVKLIPDSVSLAVPATLGRVLDIFTSAEGASQLPVSVPTAAALLCLVFALGASANVGRVILMRIAGQRIVQDARKAGKRASIGHQAQLHAI